MPKPNLNDPPVYGGSNWKQRMQADKLRSEDYQARLRGMQGLAQGAQAGGFQIQAQEMQNVGAMGIAKLREAGETTRHGETIGMEGEKLAQTGKYQQFMLGLESDRIGMQGRQDAATAAYQKGSLAIQEKTLAQRVREDTAKRFKEFAGMDPENRSTFMKGPEHAEMLNKQFRESYGLLNDPNISEEKKAAIWQRTPPEIKEMLGESFNEAYGE